MTSKFLKRTSLIRGHLTAFVGLRWGYKYFWRNLLTLITMKSVLRRDLYIYSYIIYYKYLSSSRIPFFHFMIFIIFVCLRFQDYAKSICKLSKLIFKEETIKLAVNNKYRKK